MDLDPDTYSSTSEMQMAVSTSEAFSIVLGLADVKTDISVYPNPVLEYFTITTEQAATVVIYDIGGKLASRKQVLPKVHVEGLKPGLYLLLVKDEYGMH